MVKTPRGGGQEINIPPAEPRGQKKKKKLLQSKVNNNRNGAPSTENCQSSNAPSAALHSLQPL